MNPVGAAYIVGLTGGIGSGKSTVAAAFAALGIEVIDADAVSHEMSRAGAPGWIGIRGQLGERFIGADGEIDRPALRAAVFSDPALKRRLESILHPLIRAEIDRRVDASTSEYAILMVPLLVESGQYRSRVDRLLVVDCAEEEQVRRVVARSGLAPDEVRAIMATQADRATRLAAADDVIDNSGDPVLIVPQVHDLDRQYRLLAGQARRAGPANGADERR